MVQKPLCAKSVVYVIRYTRYTRQTVAPFFSTSTSTSVYRGPLFPVSECGKRKNQTRAGKGGDNAPIVVVGKRG